MTSQRWWTGAGVVLVIGLGAVGTLGRSEAGPPIKPVGGSLAVDDVSAVCPDVTGKSDSPTVLSVGSVGRLAGLTGSPEITRSVLGQPGRPQPVTAGPVDRTTIKSKLHAVVVRARGDGAAGVVAEQQRLVPGGLRRGLFATPCSAPATDVWLTGTDGRIGYNDTLVLANPESTVANLTVTAWATSGPVAPPKLQSFTLGPGTAERLKVADYVPDKASVTLHVHANSGRVAAQILDSRVSGIKAAGVDWIAPTQPPSRTVVVPGIPRGDGARELVVTNPGDADATVSLRLATPSGNFVPAAHPSLVVAAGHSLAVDLGPSFDGVAGAIVLSSDEPVVAAAVSQLTVPGNGAYRSEVAWEPAGQPLSGPSVLLDNAPPFDDTVRLYLTAPQAAATVRLTTATGTKKEFVVPTGRTLQIDTARDIGTPSYSVLLVTPISGGPVYASRFLYALGAHGPLATTEQPVSLPMSITLPPAVEDQRAGVH